MIGESTVPVATTTHQADAACERVPGAGPRAVQPGFPASASARRGAQART